MIEAAGAGMVMLTGVQSNQFPRALDLAKPLRAPRHSSWHWRLSRLRRAVDAQRRRCRPRPRQGHGRVAVCRRSRRRLDEVLHDAAAGTLKPLYNFMNDLPGIDGTPIPLMAAERVQRTGRGDDQFRRRPRLPLPVFVLHHHQRAGAQIAPPLARRYRKDRACELRAGPAQLFHHRRQFCPQQGLGNHPRPFVSSARGREIQYRFHHPGGYALLQAAERHREMRARRRQARLHRSGEHQSGNLSGAKKKQNKITEYRTMLLAWKAARVITYGRLHSRLSERQPSVDHARYRRDQAGVAGRSARVLLSDAATRAPRITSSCTKPAPSSTPT